MAGREAPPSSWRRQLAHRLSRRLVGADLDALEHRLVLEIQASGRLRDERDAALAASAAVTAGELAELTRRVEALEGTLRELGAAMSREHGLAGAAGAYRESLYLLHELRRDLRAHLHATATTGPADSTATTGTPPPTAAQGAEERPPAPAPAADPYAGKHPRRFDYAGFERRFRGDPDAVRALLTERYLELLLATVAEVGGPVVDIGCGRGELLGVLHERGLDVVGVEPDDALAAQARERGVPVVQSLGADYLRGLPDASLAAVVSFHVVEHLVVDDLIELLELVARKLRPGGLLVAETPNPTTFLTLHESYLLDPTHVQALPPALLSWLAETAGFRSVEISYYAPAESLWTPPLRGEGPLVEQIDAAFARLNHQLYGPQDYAVLARA